MASQVVETRVGSYVSRSDLQREPPSKLARQGGSRGPGPRVRFSVPGAPTEGGPFDPKKAMDESLDDVVAGLENTKLMDEARKGSAAVRQMSQVDRTRVGVGSKKELKKPQSVIKEGDVEHIVWAGATRPGGG